MVALGGGAVSYERDTPAPRINHFRRENVISGYKQSAFVSWTLLSRWRGEHFTGHVSFYYPYREPATYAKDAGYVSGLVKGLPLSSERGTYKTVTARFWPGLSGQSPNTL